MKYWLWEIGILIFSIVIIYSGAKTLRQSPEEFIAERERWAKEQAVKEGVSEEKKMRQYVTPYRASTKSWQLYFGGGAIAAGGVLLLALVALVIYDLTA